MPLLYRYCLQHDSVFNYYKFPCRLIIHVLGNYFARLASSGRVEPTAAPPCKMIILRCLAPTRLPSSIPEAIGPRFLSALPWTQRAISSSSVYRSVSTDRHGVLLPFVIYAALSSGPRQRSRSFESIRRLYIRSFPSSRPPSPRYRNRYRDSRSPRTPESWFSARDWEVLPLHPAPPLGASEEVRSSRPQPH